MGEISSCCVSLVLTEALEKGSSPLLSFLRSIAVVALNCVKRGLLETAFA